MPRIQSSTVSVPPAGGKGTIVGSYSEKDFTSQGAREPEVVLEKNNVSHQIKLYANTPHSFFNQQRTLFGVDASQDAWQRMLSFFQEHLH